MRSRRWRSGSVGPPDPGRGCPELVNTPHGHRRMHVAIFPPKVPFKFIFGLAWPEPRAWDVRGKSFWSFLFGLFPHEQG
jgi:hypothetical protein